MPVKLSPRGLRISYVPDASKEIAMMLRKFHITLAVTVLVLAGAAVAGSLPTSAGTAIEYGLIVALWP